MLAISLLISAWGCDRYDPDGVSVSPPCAEQRIELLRPRRDIEDAYVDSWIVAELACEAPEAELVLTGPEGALDGTLSLHKSELQRRLRPSPRLAPDTPYSGRIDTADGFRRWSFTTSSTGAPVGGALDGLGAAVEPGGGDLLDPPGAGWLLAEELGAMSPVIQARGDADQTWPVRLGARSGDADEGSQDGSRRTWDIELQWNDPFFQSAPVDLRWRLDTFALVLEDAVLRGAVDPGTSRIDGFSIEALWDTREAEAALGAGSLCEADTDGQGEGCVPCRDLEVACLPFLVVHAPGQPWPGSLTEVQ